MKNFWTKLCLFNWSHRNIVVPIASAILVIALAGGALFVTDHLFDDIEEDWAKASIEEVQAEPSIEVTPSPVVTVEPSEMTSLGVDYTGKNYVTCHVAGDSMEKDLNLYMTDASGAKMTGFPSSYKLIEASQGGEISKLTAPIKTASAAIKAKTASGADFDTLNALYKEKQDAVDAYLGYIEMLEGETLSDDDGDGHIYLKDMKPGTYVACYLSDSELDPDDYMSYVTVKDHIEYQVIETITQQVGAYDASADTDNHHEDEEPNKKPEDNKPAEEVSPYVEAASVVLPVKSSAGGVAEVTFTDEGKTVKVTIQQVSSDAKGVTFEGIISDGENFSALLDKTYLEADGIITVTVKVNMSGATQTADIEIKISDPPAGDKLTDEEGHVLYSDDKGTLATAEDHAAGKKLYYKNDEDAIDISTSNEAPTSTVVATTSAVSTGNKGIDVSKYQGDINWSKVASSGIKFAIIRAGGRYSKGEHSGELYEDPYFYQNMAGAKAAGLSVGVYFYSTALTEAEAIEEASLAVAMAKEAGGVNLPIYFDMEDKTRGVSSLSKSKCNALVKAFCSTVQSAGYNAGVYASRNWYRDHLNASELPSSIKIWMAMYSDQLEWDGKVDMWQYSYKGKVSGIAGEVDMNLCF